MATLTQDYYRIKRVTNDPQVQRRVRWLARGPVHVAKEGWREGDRLQVRTYYWCWPMSRFTRLAELTTYNKWDGLFGETTGFSVQFGTLHIEIVNKKEGE